MTSRFVRFDWRNDTSLKDNLFLNQRIFDYVADRDVEQTDLLTGARSRRAYQPQVSPL